MTKVDRRPRVRGATTFLRLDLSQTPSLPQRGWVLRLTGCGHVDNASALPTGSTAHNSRHRRLLPRQFEARKPEFPPQFGRTRSRIVSETPTDSSEEAITSMMVIVCIRSRDIRLLACEGRIRIHTLCVSGNFGAFTDRDQSDHS